MSQQLLDMSIQQQNSRVGQLVRNEIVRSTRPAGSQGSNRYHLKLTSVGRASTLIDTTDTVHRRLAYNLTTNFSLIDNQSNRAIFTGRAFSKIPYDRLNASFANIQARTNAEEQAAKQVGQEIKTRVAAYFATN